MMPKMLNFDSYYKRRLERRLMGVSRCGTPFLQESSCLASTFENSIIRPSNITMLMITTPRMHIKSMLISLQRGFVTPSSNLDFRAYYLAFIQSIARVSPMCLAYSHTCLLIFVDGSLCLLVVAANKEAALIQVYLLVGPGMWHFYVASVAKRLGVSLKKGLLLRLYTFSLNGSLNSLAFH